MKKKTVMLIGCNGEIGSALYNDLKDCYNWVLCGRSDDPLNRLEYRKADFTNPRDVERVFREKKVDVVISLVALEEAPNLPDLDLFDRMAKTYLYSTYYILDAMRRYGVKKFILASSNHVTDFYEFRGFSLLGREISVQDYPKNSSAYASLKLAAESLCHNFYVNCGIDTVAFRIGTFRRKVDWDTAPDRWKRTILKEEDLVEAFVTAIEKHSLQRVHYLVSDNPDKPWNIDKLKKWIDWGRSTIYGGNNPRLPN